jgi:hypothetical protein
MKKLLILVFLGLNFTAFAQLDTNVLKLIETYDKALKSCYKSSNDLALSYEKYIDSLETNCLDSAKVETLIIVYDSALKVCRADYEQLTDAYFQLDSLYQDRIKTSDMIIRQERKNAKYRRYRAFFIGGFVGIITGIAIKD